MSKITQSYLKYMNEMMKQLPGYAFLSDTEHRFIAANDDYVKLIGYESIDQIRGLTLNELDTPLKVDQAQLEQLDCEVMRTREEMKIISCHYFSKHKQHITLAGKTPFYNLKGDLVGVMNVFYEINTDVFFSYIQEWMGSGKTQSMSQDATRKQIIQMYADKLDVSKRQAEIVFYMVQGKTSKQIGELLYISSRTVEKHITNIKTQMRCDSTVEVITQALSIGSMFNLSKNMYAIQIPLRLDSKGRIK